MNIRRIALVLTILIAVLNTARADIETGDIQIVKGLINALTEGYQYPEKLDYKGQYIYLGDDAFLYVDYGAPIVAGTHYLNTKTLKSQRLFSSDIYEVVSIGDASKPTVIISKFANGRRGSGLFSYEVMEIHSSGLVNSLGEFNVNYDMEGGLCRRAIALQHESEGYIDKPIVTKTDSEVTITLNKHVTNCSTMQSISESKVIKLSVN